MQTMLFREHKYYSLAAHTLRFVDERAEIIEKYTDEVDYSHSLRENPLGLYLNKAVLTLGELEFQIPFVDSTSFDLSFQQISVQESKNKYLYIIVRKKQVFGVLDYCFDLAKTHIRLEITQQRLIVSWPKFLRAG